MINDLGWIRALCSYSAKYRKPGREGGKEEERSWWRNYCTTRSGFIVSC